MVPGVGQVELSRWTARSRESRCFAVSDRTLCVTPPPTHPPLHPLRRRQRTPPCILPSKTSCRVVCFFLVFHVGFKQLGSAFFSQRVVTTRSDPNAVADDTTTAASIPPSPPPQMRVEAARLVRTLCNGSDLTLQTLISCGGLSVLAQFLAAGGPRIDGDGATGADARRLVRIGIDGVLKVFSLQRIRRNDFCKLFLRLGLMPRVMVGTFVPCMFVPITSLLGWAGDVVPVSVTGVEQTGEGMGGGGSSDVAVSLRTGGPIGCTIDDAGNFFRPARTLPGGGAR